MIEKDKTYSSTKYIKLYAGRTSLGRVDVMCQAAVMEALGDLPVLLEEGTYRFEVSVTKLSDKPEPTI